MFQNMFFYLFLCLLFFGVGDFLSVVTKAKVSSVFVSLLLFLVAFIVNFQKFSHSGQSRGDLLAA